MQEALTRGSVRERFFRDRGRDRGRSFRSFAVGWRCDKRKLDGIDTTGGSYVESVDDDDARGYLSQNGSGGIGGLSEFRYEHPSKTHAMTRAFDDQGLLRVE